MDENIDHPAVEVKPLLDEENHRFEIPRDTTVFCWVALAVGTRNRIPQIRSGRGSRLFDTVVGIQDRISWSISIDGESIPLIADSYYRADGYKGLAWWIAFDPVELPTSVRVQFDTNGNQPTDRGEPVVLWTEQGVPIRWGTTKRTTIELDPADAPKSEFPTRRENLWGRHTVYLLRSVEEGTR